MRFLLGFLLVLNTLYSQDYTSYNNLVTLANKMMVAERYQEANIIYKAVDQEYGLLYKSLDLYYWAISEAKVGNELIAYDLLLKSSKISNDGHDIFLALMDENVFSFLTEKQLKDINAVKRKIKQKNLDLVLVQKLAYIDSIDTYWHNYLDSVTRFESDQYILKKHKTLCQENLQENNNHFTEFILKFGYPDFLKTNIAVTHLLYQMNNKDWKQADKMLLKALSNGYLSSFDYAYTYFKTHEIDKYKATTFKEYSDSNQRTEVELLKENGRIGMGL